MRSGASKTSYQRFRNNLQLHFNFWNFKSQGYSKPELVTDLLNFHSKENLLRLLLIFSFVQRKIYYICSRNNTDTKEFFFCDFDIVSNMKLVHLGRTGHIKRMQCNRNVKKSPRKRTHFLTLYCHEPLTSQARACQPTVGLTCPQWWKIIQPV